MIYQQRYLSIIMYIANTGQRFNGKQQQGFYPKIPPRGIILLLYHTKRHRSASDSRILLTLSLRRIRTHQPPHIPHKRLHLLLGHRVRMLLRRITAPLNLIPITLNSLQRLTPHIPILLHKLGQKPSGREIPRHVRLHQHLSGRAITSPDPNRRNFEQTRDKAGNLLRHGLHDHGESTGFLHGKGVPQQPLGGFFGLALHAEAAEGVLALGSEPDVCEHGDAGGGDGADGGGHLGAALELDGGHAAFFDEADGGGEGLLGGDFVGAHGHVADLEVVLVGVCSLLWGMVWYGMVWCSE